MGLPIRGPRHPVQHRVRKKGPVLRGERGDLLHERCVGLCGDVLHDRASRILLELPLIGRAFAALVRLRGGLDLPESGAPFRERRARLVEELLQLKRASGLLN